MYGKDRARTKLADAILNVLIKEFPLGAREAYNKIRKEIPITYQGVHKALNQLVSEGKVIKRNRGYSLNGKWITDQVDFFDKISSVYSGTELFEMGGMKEGETKTLMFNSAIKMAYWLIDEINKILIKKSRKHSIIQFRWFWPGIMVSDKQYPNLQRMEKQGNFINTAEKQTELDKIFSKYYEGLGKSKTIFNYPLEDGIEHIVVHNYVFKILWSKKTIEERRKIYEQTPDLKEALSRLYRHGFRKDKITVIIIKNGELANNIRRSVEKRLK